MTLAEAVRAHRAIQKLTQRELAEQLRITRQTVMAIEAGSSPRWDLVLRLSRVLDFSLDSLSA